MFRKMQSSWARPSILAASLATGTLVTAFAGPATAATEPPTKTVEIKVIDLHKWKLDPATGWSVKKLVGKKVKGPKGENVGEVDNIIFGPEGKVHEVIVSTGGFLGVGEKNLAVKWSDVTISPDYEFVTTPITAETVKKYGLFDGIPKSSGPLMARDWRSSELIGDYVYLKGNVHYAYVRDLIVSQTGELQAVIVSPDVGFSHGGDGLYAGGYYAYPFYGYGYGHGWNPGNAHYNLPYDKADVKELLPYAYRK
jgi:sporulation protein YlmC with PRC-barrel domain